MENSTNKNTFVPSPTYGNSFRFGWTQLFKHFLHLFLVSVIIGLLMFPSAFTWHIDSAHDITWYLVVIQLFAFAYWMLLFPIFDFGADLLYLRAIRDEPIDIKEMFKGFDRYLDIILANLLTASIIIIGLVFLIVPGILFACRLVFVPYLVMDRQLDPVKAVEKSWYMTKNYGWTIFGMGVTGFFLGILGLLLLIVGIYPAMMWVSASFASLYYAIDEKEKSELSNGD